MYRAARALFAASAITPPLVPRSRVPPPALPSVRSQYELLASQSRAPAAVGSSQVIARKDCQREPTLCRASSHRPKVGLHRRSGSLLRWFLASLLFLLDSLPGGLLGREGAVGADDRRSRQNHACGERGESGRDYELLHDASLLIFPGSSPLAGSDHKSIGVTPERRKLGSLCVADRKDCQS